MNYTNKIKFIIPIILLLLLAVSVLAEVNYYYKIDLQYQDGDVSYDRISVEPTFKELQTAEGMYVAEVVSFDNRLLNLTFFDFPLTIFYDTVDPETGEINGGGMTELNETEITLYVPYQENAQEINIYDENLDELLKIDVSYFAKETAVSGEAEELEGKKIADDKMLEKKKIAEANPTIKVVGGVFLGIVVIALLVLVIIMLGRRKRNK